QHFLAGVHAPRHSLGRDRKVQLFESDPRIRRAEMKIRRNDAMVQRQRELREPGDAGCRLEVTDVRFHRAEPERVVALLYATEHLPKRRCFDRIAYRRARTVRFDIAHELWRNACTAVNI